MSVRKRTWFTNLQRKDVDPKAREIATVRGKPGDWKKYIEQAAETLGIEPQEAWIVDYIANGSRHIETFERKKDADAREAEVTVNVDKGIHTATSKSITVAQAAEDWLAYVGGEGRERGTLEQYEQHVRLHIVPRIGNEKLARLTTPRIQALRDELIKSMSRPMAKKVLTSLKGILKDAKRRGNVAQNAWRVTYRSRSTGGQRPNLRLA